MEDPQLSIIRDLQAKETELKDLQQRIATKREENKKSLLQEEQRLENALSPLLEESKKKSHELTTLFSKNTVSISLADLVGELSKLSGISILNMRIEVDFESPIRYRTGCEEILLDSDFSKNCVYVYIYGDNSLDRLDTSQPFQYEIRNSINLRELQADGKTFFDHCSDCNQIGFEHKELKVDKRIGDIICHIDMEKIIRGDKYNWNPSSLLIEAIMNCIQDGKSVIPEEIGKQKVLS